MDSLGPGVMNNVLTHGTLMALVPIATFFLVAWLGFSDVWSAIGSLKLNSCTRIINDFQLQYLWFTCALQVLFTELGKKKLTLDSKKNQSTKKINPGLPQNLIKSIAYLNHLIETCLRTCLLLLTYL